ncbi:carotenoid isomerooxygenase isoform X1 [Trichogramma pretiosum]|uniref:carotenoid isomerooxygenase isoform X1 n=2 Tax=Trichogramma pretiosum TaxID=7493 RepID=UPI0006C9444B|nr:carotenoid isomerooxygenase isoform X1 [Trichogramma pretiosum]
MFAYRKSKSLDNINTSKWNVIKKYLDRKNSLQIFPKIQNNLECKKTSENKTKGLPGQDDSINYYPNVDTSIWMRSCEQEVVEPMSGTLTGYIPDWLKGTLLRNGPGSLKVGEYRFDHLFDSSALLHRFEINNGKVTYQRRFIQTDVFKKNQAAKRIVVTEFGTRATPDPCQSIFERVSAAFHPAENLSDNSMISVYPFGDEYYTFTESPVIHRIDPKSLETINKVNVANYVSIVSHTSHPHVMSDGTVYNLGMSITKKGPAYSIVEFSPFHYTADEKRKKRKISMFDEAKIVSTVHSRWVLNPAYMHSFGITDNYFIIIEQPLAIALVSMVTCQIKNEPMCGCLKFHENENTHIHLISRKSGKIERTFIAEGFFYLHVINQYETRDGGYVVLDLCCYRDAKMLDCMYVEAMENMHKNPDYSNLFRGRPLRFILPLKTPDDQISSDTNLITINDVYQKSDTFDDRLNMSKLTKEKGISNDGGDNNSVEENFLNKKAAAYKLPNGEIFVKPELLCDLGCETPRINNSLHLGKEYRYFYAVSSDVDIENPGTIIKVDTKNKTKKIWSEKGIYPSEPIFVQDPNKKNEDDGVVLSALVWGQERETTVGLLILDASSFEEVGRVVFDTPGPVPKCLHGWFCDLVS